MEADRESVRTKDVVDVLIRSQKEKDRTGGTDGHS